MVPKHVVCGAFHSGFTVEQSFCVGIGQHARDFFQFHLDFSSVDRFYDLVQRTVVSIVRKGRGSGASQSQKK